MNRRSTGAGWFCRLALVAPFWAIQLLAMDGKREADGNLPAGAAYLEVAREDVAVEIEEAFDADRADRPPAGARSGFTRYLGQTPPGPTPRLFELQTHERFFASDRIAISKDGKELYYTEVTNTWSDTNIRYYEYVDDRWSGPLDLFSGFLGPALSVDGKTMYFERYGEQKTCWQSRRTGKGWSAPTSCADLPDPKNKHYRQDTDSGRIYASSEGALNGLGRMDISTYVKTGVQGTFHSLGRPLNSPGNEGDFHVSRDEAFIVFASPHRGGFGGADLFVSFREGDGSWSVPANLGATINTPGSEFGPYVTEDRKFLFYSSSSDFTRVDIHWVRFDSLLETLRKR